MFSATIKPTQKVNLMGKESSHNSHIYLKALGKNLKSHQIVAYLEKVYVGRGTLTFSRYFGSVSMFYCSCDLKWKNKTLKKSYKNATPQNWFPQSPGLTFTESVKKF